MYTTQEQTPRLQRPTGCTLVSRLQGPRVRGKNLYQLAKPDSAMTTLLYGRPNPFSATSARLSPASFAILRRVALWTNFQGFIFIQTTAHVTYQPHCIYRQVLCWAPSLSQGLTSDWGHGALVLLSY